MTFAELIGRVAYGAGITKADASRALDAVKAAIQSELREGRDVFIPGLGRFETKERKARAGRNPASGETIAIPAKRVPKFSPAKALKDAVAG